MSKDATFSLTLQVRTDAYAGASEAADRLVDFLDEYPGQIHVAQPLSLPAASEGSRRDSLLLAHSLAHTIGLADLTDEDEARLTTLLHHYGYEAGIWAREGEGYQITVLRVCAADPALSQDA